MRLAALARRAGLLALLVVLSPSAAAFAQGSPGGYESDVGSLDAIVAALYGVLSGPAGQARNWERFEHLFHPMAGRLMGMAVDPEGRIRHRASTPAEYARGAGPGLEANGFFEEEIGREEHRFGNVAHLFSAYASRRTPEDAEPYMRGVKSIQAMWDGQRWWIVTVLWDQERPDDPIPERYLGRG